MIRSHTVVAALVACAFVSASAAADPNKKPKPKDAAEAAYLEGRRHYDLREWDDAIASFKESYRLRADERSLFNIAQAYRLKGDCVEALGFYQTYKRNFPDADGISSVDKLIADIDPCVRAHGASPDKPAVDTQPTTTQPTTTTTDKTPPDATDHGTRHENDAANKPDKSDKSQHNSDTDPIDVPPPANPGHGMRVTGITAAAIGVVAIGGGVFFALQAQDKSNAVGTGTGVFDPQLQSDGQAANRNAEILFGVGGALAVTGVVLYVIGRPSSTAEHLAIVPSRSGGTLSWRASF